MRLLFLAVISWAPAQTWAIEDAGTARGTIVHHEEIGVLSKEDIAEELSSGGVPGIPAYGVVLYRVIYQTVNHDGQPVRASGAIAIPLNLKEPAPLLSYQHGTVSARHRVPSQSGFDLISMGLGGSGYVTVLPDYIGLGESDAFHPYVHAKSLGVAVVDLLRAARSMCEDLDVPLNEQLFLVGYSEGGYATMAAHREIELHHSDEFTVTASAPMAGPYNLSEVMVEQILEHRPYPSPGYLPYTLISYDRVYNVFGGMQGVLQEPYASQMEAMFDGTQMLREINDQLPRVPLEMLEDNFVESLRQQDHPLREILKQNDVHNWAPVAPMRLFHCVDDDQVSFKNAEMALRAFRRHGANHVELAALEFGDHKDCAPPALFLGKLWFDGFKEDRRPVPLQANIKIIKAGAF